MSLLRRSARAAVGTLVVGTVGGVALIAAEAVMAKTRRYAKPDLRLAMRTTIGDSSAAPLRLVLLGDSGAQGVGVANVTDTVGGRLAELLAESLGAARRVELSSVAVSGSRAEDLATQVARALLGGRPDIAVILIGANDATGLRRPGQAAAHLGLAVGRLRDAGIAVVVGTCPDLGASPAFARPLRQIVGLLGQRMARAQTIAVARSGGIPIDLATRTGPVFRADAGAFCDDGYHPSADGYRVWAHALFPAVAEAAGMTRAG